MAPCATKPGEIVTNGWSSSRRARSTANSGIVVELELADLKAYEAQYGPLSAMVFQSEIERKAWEAGGRTQTAPAQRLVDFVEGQVSKDLPKTSYAPGLRSVNLAEVLPEFIIRRLRAGFMVFDQRMKGYLTNEAIVHAPETRTSSPVRIPREPERLVHPEVDGLYPCGEGAGYAGGIVSAAMDGERVAEAVVRSVRGNRGKYGLNFRFDVQTGCVFNKFRKIFFPIFLGGNIAIHTIFHVLIALLADTQVGGTVIIIEQLITDQDIVFKVIL